MSGRIVFVVCHEILIEMHQNKYVPSQKIVSDAIWPQPWVEKFEYLWF